MQRFIMRYPDDPPIEVLEMTREEFLRAHPRTGITIKSWGGPEGYKVGYVPQGSDEIQCDFCGQDPGNLIYVYRGTKGHCKACYESNWKRYCEPA